MGDSRAGIDERLGSERLKRGWVGRRSRMNRRECEVAHGAVSSLATSKDRCSEGVLLERDT